MKNYKLILLLFVTSLFLLSGLLFDVDLAQAVACGSNSRIGNSSYWGEIASQNVRLSKGSSVKISVTGEDGCAGQSAQFQIKKGSTTVSTVSVALIKGQAIPGDRLSGYFLYGNWTINVDPGDYKFQLIKVGSQNIQASPSSNNLTVLTQQTCFLDKVYGNPSRGKGGTRVLLTVESRGTCQTYKASINVFATQSRSTEPVFRGSEQTFQTNNKLEWGWNLPSNVAPNTTYRIDVILKPGDQVLQSSLLTVTETGTQETPTSPPKPGETQEINFSIPNPIQANNFIELIGVITTWLFNLAIPIAVAMIVYAGVLFLISRGDTTKVTQARKILLYAVLGLAIILIGKGFITLIESVLNLGAGS